MFRLFWYSEIMFSLNTFGYSIIRKEDNDLISHGDEEYKPQQSEYNACKFQQHKQELLVQEQRVWPANCATDSIYFISLGMIST